MKVICNGKTESIGEEVKTDMEGNAIPDPNLVVHVNDVLRQIHKCRDPFTEIDEQGRRVGPRDGMTIPDVTIVITNHEANAKFEFDELPKIKGVTYKREGATAVVPPVEPPKVPELPGEKTERPKK
jgi:hypothetical protein